MTAVKVGQRRKFESEPGAYAIYKVLDKQQSTVGTRPWEATVEYLETSPAWNGSDPGTVFTWLLEAVEQDELLPEPKPEFKVGQVWKTPIIGEEYRITALEPDGTMTVMMTAGPNEGRVMNWFPEFSKSDTLVENVAEDPFPFQVGDRVSLAPGRTEGITILALPPELPEVFIGQYPSAEDGPLIFRKEVRGAAWHKVVEAEPTRKQWVIETERRIPDPHNVIVQDGGWLCEVLNGDDWGTQDVLINDTPAVLQS